MTRLERPNSSLPKKRSQVISTSYESGRPVTPNPLDPADSELKGAESGKQSQVKKTFPDLMG